ncbi:hypothetical protein [Actinacidiphila paucisporea]|uniref:Uncharacterized protein n=1 Tax=Actinacidiphila paucisporea TaxID=310782 RepID=A0A1M7QY63_9ACTN|nr:hypothetical protein [Actinacidiphila paucisporea]SHN37054.1 hypothetical protein SAMN05216499_1497 [Actinacidiphila paucisporea]
MGASDREYVTPYMGEIEATLEALHKQVFQEEYGDGGRYGSLVEFYRDVESIGVSGTHTVLDVVRVVTTTDAPDEESEEDFSTLRPLSPERITHHLGVKHPTVQQFRACRTLNEEAGMRWNGFYILLYTDGEPTHVGVFDASGD